LRKQMNVQGSLAGKSSAPIRPKVIGGPVLITMDSAMAEKLELRGRVLGPQVAHGHAYPGKGEQELDPPLAAQGARARRVSQPAEAGLLH
jgi:hypothetical protein